ncbi:hypothetical protein [Natronobacterium haloterrestre]|uniref:hypothetical protein n=1 Tax=Natronobacterium haloterrestre TaxID=148448 RepID=UPI0015A538B8|nr:hypothetical protein [Halobiforma haloterrestris]
MGFGDRLKIEMIEERRRMDVVTIDRLGVAREYYARSSSSEHVQELVAVTSVRPRRSRSELRGVIVASENDFLELRWNHRFSRSWPLVSGHPDGNHVLDVKHPYVVSFEDVQRPSVGVFASPRALGGDHVGEIGDIAPGSFERFFLESIREFVAKLLDECSSADDRPCVGLGIEQRWRIALPRHREAVIGVRFDDVAENRRDGLRVRLRNVGEPLYERRETGVGVVDRFQHLNPLLGWACTLGKRVFHSVQRRRIDRPVVGWRVRWRPSMFERTKQRSPVEFVRVECLTD